MSQRSGSDSNDILTLDDKMTRFRSLTLRRNQARKLNHEEVVEEDRRQKLPSNFEARQSRAQWQLTEEKNRTECAERGEDYDRQKLLNVGADEAQRWHRAKYRKKNPDPGFADYEQSALRHHDTLVKQIKPDMQKYEEEKAKFGEEFYPTLNTLLVGKHRDTKEAIDKMVADVERQAVKRARFHRRRPYDPEEQIDFINERNKRFNKKIERFYGQYTQEIKQNLERGTAV